MLFQFGYLSATERRSTAAKRDDLHSKSLFLVTNKGKCDARWQDAMRDVRMRCAMLGCDARMLCNMEHRILTSRIAS